MRKHSNSFQELMAAYQQFQDRLFDWTHENAHTKQADLLCELSQPICRRDLHKRLFLLNLLKSTEMWDIQAIASVCSELTEIALYEQDEIAADAQLALQKLCRLPQKSAVAAKVFALAQQETQKPQPDELVFHNGAMLLYGLECAKEFSEFIAQYHFFVFCASGLEKNDLEQMRQILFLKTQ